MFIPVSLVSGAASVDIVANITGTLVAQCAVVHKGKSYNAGDNVSVAAGDPVRLSTTVTAYKEISVALGGKTYYWFVDLPKSLRYVADRAFLRTAGTTYGALYHASGTSVPYTATSTFTAGDAVAAIDFVKKEIWFFNSKNEVKKLVVPDTPVAVVYAPRWSQTDSVVTTAFVIAESNIYKLNALFEITDTYPFSSSSLAGKALAASGDVDGKIVIATTERLHTWNPVTGRGVEGWLNYPNPHSVYVMADNTYIIGCDLGLVSQKANGTEKTVMLSGKGLYVGFALTEKTLYTVDAYNRCLLAYDIATKTFKTRYFDNVPRSVTVDGTKLIVGFTNSNVSVDVTMDLATVTARPATVKTFGASVLGDYVFTDLYSNAADVTLAEPDVTPVVIGLDEQPLNTPMHFEWTVDWERPEYVRLGTTAATVKVNGASFADGYLRKGDVIVVDAPASSTYYDDRQVSFVGRRATTILLRTEARRYPDEVTIPAINDAFPKYEYLYSYTVSGLTDGFSADVVLDKDDLDISFDVNNTGTFRRTGTVRNGDTVTVRAYLGKLIAKRTPHIAYTGPDNKWHVFNWSLLTITPNGVTVRQEKTEAKERYHDIAPQPAIASQEYRTGMLGHSVAVTALTAFTVEKMLQGSLVPFDGSNAVHDGCQWYEIPGALHAFDVRYSTVAATQAAATHARYGAMQVQGFDGSLSGSGTQTAFSLEGLHYPTPFSSAVEAQYGKTASTQQYQFRATIEKNVFHHMEAQSIKVARNTSLRSESVAAAFDRYQMHRVHRIGTEWNKTASLTFVYGELDLAKHWQLNQVWSRIYIDAVFDEVFHRVPKYAINTATDRQQFGDVVAISARFERLAYRPDVAVDTAFELVRTKKSPSILVQYELIRSGSILATMPVAEFVRESHRDNPLTDLVSGFGSRAQAEAYFASLKLTGEPTYVQFNGKWAFTVAPVADNAVCLATVPGSPGRGIAYGYLGGG